jgi:hypothetical protein
VVNFCSKWIPKNISCIFSEVPISSHVAKTAYGLKGKVPQRKFVLPMESWVSFSSNFCFCSWFYMMSFSFERACNKVLIKSGNSN